MTKELPSLGAMAMELLTIELGTVIALQAGLEKALVKIEQTAVSEFGVYQPGVAYFPGWDELADATKADRVAQGYSENEPLLRSGDLRASVGHEIHALDGVVGSTDDVMIYHELGTSHMPPRPVLGPAAYRNKEDVENLIGAAFVGWIIGGTVPTIAD